MHGSRLDGMHLCQKQLLIFGEYTPVLLEEALDRKGPNLWNAVATNKGEVFKTLMYI
jgi:hypothetical protein